VLSYFRLEGALVQQARAGLLGVPSPARHSAAARPAPERRAAVGTWLSGLAAAGLLLALILSADRASAPDRPPSQARIPDLRPVGERTTPEITPPPATPLALAAPTQSGVEKPAPALPPALPPSSAPPGVRSSLPDPSPPAPELAPGSGTRSDGGKSPEAILTEVLIERVEGDAALVGTGTRTPAHAGDVVSAGQGLETGPGKSLAVLSFPDGTRIEARPETVLRDIRGKGGSPVKGGKSLYLQHGSVWAQVRPQPADHPLVLQSPRGEIRVLGTVFTLRMDADPKGVLRLDVQEGKVHFSRASDGRAVDVGAGQSASTGQSADLVALRSQDVIQSFQDGRFPAADYAGTRDTQLVEKSPQTTFGSAKTLLAEADDLREKRKASWPLLRWDLSSIPSGSRVHSVAVALHIVEASRGQAFYFFEPSRPWVETEATWKLASAETLWRFPGSLGAVERWPAPLGTLTPLQKGEYTTMLGDAGVLLVQSWINAPASNLGLEIAGASGSSGFHFNSREASAPESRPRLTVIYTPRK